MASVGGRIYPSDKAIGHLRSYTEDGLAAKMTAAGLRVEWVRSWGYPFYSPLVRATVERLPTGPPTGAMGRKSKAAAAMLYQLYRLNLPGRGDVITALGRT